MVGDVDLGGLGPQGGRGQDGQGDEEGRDGGGTGRVTKHGGTPFYLARAAPRAYASAMRASLRAAAPARPPPQWTIPATGAPR